MADWAAESGLVILNEGDVTRVERGSGRVSSPDVSLCSQPLAGELGWRVVKALGSDHFPILISSGEAVQQGENKGRLVWDWKRADWDGFRKEVRRGLGRVEWEGLSVGQKEEQFRRVVLRGARRWVGKKKVGGKGWKGVSEEIRMEMERRDGLKGEEVIEWEEVKRSEEKIKEMVCEEKRERWRRMLEEGKSVEQMWGVLKGIRKSREEGSRKGEMLWHEGKELGSAKKKAEAFASVYERVSRVKVPKGRGLKRKLNRVVRERMSAGVGEDGGPITLVEVRRALDAMDAGKAAGPDGLHPRLLKNLPVEALKVVRDMFDQSFRMVDIPQQWRVGEIVPLLKDGKPPAAIGSYRPVCLTSCLGKWLERVLGARIRWELESRGWFSNWQAGFREGRSVDDQLVRLAQEIWDGFQAREKTALVLFDFARAYDRVWRDGLLWKLVGAGVGARMVRWVQGWLANRLAWVNVEGVRSEPRLFQQGLPQGSVLSPLLFLVFINDLVERLGSGVGVSAFADDLAVWSTGRVMERNRERVQWAARVVEKWSERWLMVVAAEKCSVSLFSMDVADTEMQGLSVRLGDHELSREKNPVFLGVAFDRSLGFFGQVERVVKRAKKSVGILRRLAGKDWGWGKAALRQTYVSLVRSVLLYGTAAWGPWLSNTAWRKIEGVQLEAARVVSGVLRSSPREAVLAEAGIPEVRRVAEGFWAAQLEKCLRTDEGDPRREWGCRKVRKRLKRKGWRERAEEVLREVVPEGVGRVGFRWGGAPWKTLENVSWDIDGGRGRALGRVGRRQWIGLGGVARLSGWCTRMGRLGKVCGMGGPE